MAIVKKRKTWEKDSRPNHDANCTLIDS